MNPKSIKPSKDHNEHIIYYILHSTTEIHYKYTTYMINNTATYDIQQ